MEKFQKRQNCAEKGSAAMKSAEERKAEITENYIRSLVFRENTEQNDNIMKAKCYIDEHL